MWIFLHRFLVVLICSTLAPFPANSDTSNNSQTIVNKTFTGIRTSLKNPAYYDLQFTKRDIFGIAPPQIDDEEMTRIRADFAQDLKVVGVALGHPSEAILQNEQTKETYFLRIGDTFKKARVHDIAKGKVTFLYKGKSIQMFQLE